MIRIGKGKFESIIIALASSWIMVGLLVFTVVWPNISANEPVSKIVSIMNKEQNVAFYRQFNSGFPFHLQKKITKLETVSAVDSFFQANPKGYLITTSEMAKDLENLQLNRFFSQKELFEPPTTMAFTKSE